MRGALGEVAGVQDVGIDLGAHSVNVQFDEGQTSKGALAEAITAAGYEPQE